MRKEVLEVRNLARKMKEDLKYEKIKMDKDGDSYDAIWKGFGARALKLEIFVPYEDLLENKDDKGLEKELWERLNGEYSNRQH